MLLVSREAPSIQHTLTECPLCAGYSARPRIMPGCGGRRGAGVCMPRQGRLVLREQQGFPMGLEMRGGWVGRLRSCEVRTWAHSEDIPLLAGGTGRAFLGRT